MSVSKVIVAKATSLERQGSALSLFVFGIFGTNNHNFAVTLYYLAFVTHGFYGRFYFHDESPFSFYCWPPLERQTILPLVRS